MDLTGPGDQDWMGRGYIEAASDDGAALRLTGDVADPPADADQVLARLTADHDVASYPEGAVLGWVAPGDLANADVRDPQEVERDPYPFETG